MSILSNIALAASALVSALVGGQGYGGGGGEGGLRYYHCDFAQGVEFFVSGRPLLPAYRCVSAPPARIHLLLASRDFRAPYSNTEWIEGLDVQLGDDVLTQVFPGSFHYVRGSVHRPVHGLEFQSESMAINGLSVINGRRLLGLPAPPGDRDWDWDWGWGWGDR